MARIYLRMPQCLQWSVLQERLSLRQIAIITCGVSILVLLGIFFVQTRLSRSENDSSFSSYALPTLGGNLNKTLFSYGPDVHYGIVLDCGSSGSRVYVYIWPPHSGNTQDLLNIQQLKDNYNEPVVKKVSPGLDTFADNPEGASEYLKPLLQFAGSHIPKSHHKETLLYIMATAGMRMIPEDSQKAILQDLQRDIPKDFDFVISEHNFEVISGKLEGVYAWIAVNYVLQKFGHGTDDHPLVAVDVPGERSSSNSQHVRRRTVGMIDMGGGSMQIAYEITSNVDQIPKHLVAEFNLGCQNNDIDHTYRVYVTTFLGFGANEARSRYEDQLLSKIPKNLARAKRAVLNTNVKNIPVDKDIQYLKKMLNMSSHFKKRSDEEEAVLPIPMSLSQPKLDPYKDIPDPCLQQGLTLPARDEEYAKKVTFKGTGDYLKCREALVPLLNLTVPCDEPPCWMNGVHQPTITFHNSEFYGFSEFWYTMEDVFRIGGLYEPDVFQAHAIDFCEKKWSMLMERYNKGLYKKADTERFRMQCFKSAWLTTVLHKGIKFPESYKNLNSVQFINKKDVQWTLGALIHRTRYLPLRDMEKTKMSHFKPSWIVTSHFLYNEYLIVVCFIIVVMAILLYIKRLRLCSQKLPRTDLSRVPSMSYFMTDMDQEEQGIRYSKNFTYP